MYHCGGGVKSRWSTMAKIRIETDRKAYAQVRQSAEVEKILTDIAESAVQKCGRGYQYKIKRYDTIKGGKPHGKFPTRIAVIIARTKAAQLDNNKNNTILKAVFGS